MSDTPNTREIYFNVDGLRVGKDEQPVLSITHLPDSHIVTYRNLKGTVYYPRRYLEELATTPSRSANPNNANEYISNEAFIDANILANATVFHHHIDFEATRYYDAKGKVVAKSQATFKITYDSENRAATVESVGFRKIPAKVYGESPVKEVILTEITLDEISNLFLNTYPANIGGQKVSLPRLTSPARPNDITQINFVNLKLQINKSQAFPQATKFTFIHTEVVDIEHLQSRDNLQTITIANALTPDYKAIGQLAEARTKANNAKNAEKPNPKDHKHFAVALRNEVYVVKKGQRIDYIIQANLSQHGWRLDISSKGQERIVGIHGGDTKEAGQLATLLEDSLKAKHMQNLHGGLGEAIHRIHKKLTNRFQPQVGDAKHQLVNRFYAVETIESPKPKNDAAKTTQTTITASGANKIALGGLAVAGLAVLAYFGLKQGTITTAEPEGSKPKPAPSADVTKINSDLTTEERELGAPEFDPAKEVQDAELRAKAKLDELMAKRLKKRDAQINPSPTPEQTVKTR